VVALPTVSLISVTPVKSLGLSHPREVELTARGVPANRRLYLVDEDGRLFNGARHGPLVQVRPTYDDSARTLSLAFPDGRVVTGQVALGEAVVTDFWGRAVRGRRVEGPWGAALSSHAGAPVHLVRAELEGDGSDVHAATIVSEASCEELGRRASAEVDPRRFRMLFTLAGCAPHEEDSWNGRPVRIGSAVVCAAGPVPRCVVTTQGPASGISDLDTLRAIGAYRGRRDGRLVDFGVYADVETPGHVRVGDAVEPL
jgi:uncharacterized protein YcbX